MVTEADLIDEHKREATIPRTALFGLYPIPDAATIAPVRRDLGLVGTGRALVALEVAWIDAHRHGAGRGRGVELGAQIVQVVREAHVRVSPRGLACPDTILRTGTPTDGHEWSQSL